jgi:hypothetical protein
MEKKKKTFNKKLLMFGVLGLFAFAMISAIAYYTLFSVTFNVTPAISIEGELEQELGGVYSGDDIVGTPIEISNDAPSERVITITDDSYLTGGNISVRYVSELELSTKNTDNWAELGDKVTVGYVVVGDEFSAEVVGEDIEGYELVYYRDAEDAQTVAERTANPQPVIRLSEISTSYLPHLVDGNWQEDTDYSGTPDFYNQWKGAKLWYVPSDAINSDNTLIWSQWDAFYYETDLIQYNSNGEIVLFPNATLTMTPIYTPSNYTSGEYTIETTIA